MNTVFPITSRYHAVDIATWQGAGGRVYPYVRRRFVPPADRFTVLQVHTVTQGERLDNLASRYLDDPEQFWRLCDANNAMRPTELETIGRKLRITLPEGIQGPVNA